MNIGKVYKAVNRWLLEEFIMAGIVSLILMLIGRQMVVTGFDVLVGCVFIGVALGVSYGAAMVFLDWGAVGRGFLERKARIETESSDEA